MPTFNVCREEGRSPRLGVLQSYGLFDAAVAFAVGYASQCNHPVHVAIYEVGRFAARARFYPEDTPEALFGEIVRNSGTETLCEIVPRERS